MSKLEKVNFRKQLYDLQKILERGEKGKTCTVEEIKVLMDAYIKGTTQQQISLYETGRRKLDEDQIAEICKVYKINPEEILENTKGESYMTKAQEIVLKIGEYIQEKDGKITFSEILEEYTKLPAPERTMVELMVEEHNKRYK